jgi:hypothetical protein
MGTKIFYQNQIDGTHPQIQPGGCQVPRSWAARRRHAVSPLAKILERHTTQLRGIRFTMNSPVCPDAHPDLVIRIRQIRDDVAALIVGDDDKRKLLVWVKPEEATSHHRGQMAEGQSGIPPNQCLRMIGLLCHLRRATGAVFVW